MPWGCPMRRIVLFVGAVAVLVASLALAAGPPQPLPPEVAKLISQLADDDFKVRRAAMKKLEDYGEGVVPALRKAGDDSRSDVDVRLRAHAVAGIIEGKLYGEQRQFTGHTDGVICVAVSPDGKMLASGAWLNYTEHV